MRIDDCQHDCHYGGPQHDIDLTNPYRACCVSDGEMEQVMFKELVTCRQPCCQAFVAPSVFSDTTPAKMPILRCVAGGCTCRLKDDGSWYQCGFCHRQYLDDCHRQYLDSEFAAKYGLTFGQARIARAEVEVSIVAMLEKYR